MEDNKQQPIGFEDLYKLSQEGMYYEYIGEIEKSIKIYEYLVDNKWEGSHVYDRLSIFYKKNKRYKDIERICTIYITYYTNWLRNNHNYSDEMIKSDNKFIKFNRKIISIKKYL
jgi:hypothetical protein